MNLIENSHLEALLYDMKFEVEYDSVGQMYDSRIRLDFLSIEDIPMTQAKLP